MRALLDVLLLVPTIGGAIGWITRRWVIRRRESNIEHVRQLELENRELDQALNQLDKGHP